MATALEASRTLLWRAASALDDDHPDKVELCAMAKRYVTDACFDVADQALQLHGGYGYLREYGLEKIVRDLRVHRILEGTNEIMRVVIGRAEAARARASHNRRRHCNDDDRVPGAGQHGRADGGQPGRGRAHRARLRPGAPRSQAAAEAKGAKVFDSGAEAVADADVVITSLPNGDVVKRVLRRGAARRQVRRTVHRHVDHLRRRRPRDPRAGRRSRASPNSTRRCPAASRAPRQARWRSWSAARTTPSSAPRPVLEPLAGKIIHCGGSGNGPGAKLCNNMVLAVQQIAVGEAFVLAEKLGLSAQSLFDVITGATGNCWAVHTNCPVPGPVPTVPTRLPTTTSSRASPPR